MAKYEPDFKVFLREVDYYSNPEVVVVVAQTLEEAKSLFEFTRKIPHDRLVMWNEKSLIEVNQGVGDMFILRPYVWNRAKYSEPVYPTLIQQGESVGEDRFLWVYLKAQGCRVETDDPYGIVIPEVVVVTAGSHREAREWFESIGSAHEDLVRTAMPRGWSPLEGEWIEIDQSIRQLFILRPRGDADLR